MNHFSMKLQRLFLTLALCVAGVAVSASVFVFAQSGGEDPIVYLPVIAGPPDTAGGGTLENGGTVQGPDGVGIGAFTDTLDAPIMVTISRTTAPTTALPSQAQMLGEFYEISAGEDVYAATESPFILAFPVPPGAGTDNLALAMLTSSDQVNDAEAGMQAWALLEGIYDADQDLFLTTIAGFHEEGNPFVLVTHPDSDSPPNNAAAVEHRSTSPQLGLFTVKCMYFLDPTHCTAATENDVATYLTDIYGRIHQEVGFTEPRLRNLVETLNFNPNSLSSLGYTVYIEPSYYGHCASGPAAGYYSPHPGRLVLCLDPLVGLHTDTFYVLVHEYFHATQFAYPLVLEDWRRGLEDDWLIEGMAQSAERSAFDVEMYRSEVGGWVELHKVDRALNSQAGLDAYFAQDFWVFYGQQQGEDLLYLQDVLTEGAKTEDVVNVLGDGDYLEPYWDWAKNQVMEKQINFGGVLQSPCFVEEQVVEEFEIFEHQWTDKLYHQLTVGPLSTAVVKLTFSHVHDFAFGWVYGHVQDQLPDAEMALAYKFYEDGENGCEAVPDGPRTWPEGEGVDPDKVYYVVISNTDYDDAYDYTITFELAFPD